MAGGNHEHHDCACLRLDLESETSPVVDAISIVLTAFLNFASLSFVIQFQTVKNIMTQALRKITYYV